MADFQQYYRVNLYEHAGHLNGWATTTDIRWLATLAAQLPYDSRTAIAEHPENAWSTSDYLLRQIDYTIRTVVWALAGGDKSGPAPEPAYSPAEIEDHEAAVKRAEEMASTVAKLLDLEI